MPALTTTLHYFPKHMHPASPRFSYQLGEVFHEGLDVPRLELARHQKNAYLRETSGRDASGISVIPLCCAHCVARAELYLPDL